MKFYFLLAVASCKRPLPFIYGEYEDAFDELTKILIANNASYLTKFLEVYEKENIDTSAEDDEFCSLGDNIPNLGDPEFTDGFFKCLMLQKCGIQERKFDQLKEYHAAHDVTDSRCLAQLEQFNDDLIDGQFHAQQMCDSWGEDIDFRNWPGLQFELFSISESGFPSYWRHTAPGLYNQCKQIHRRSNVTGETLYKGQYVLTKPLIHGIKNGGSEAIDGYRNCMTWCEEQAEEGCALLCIAGSDIHLFDYYRERGVCYPDACSAEEILILQSNVIDISTIFGYDDEGRNGQKWTDKATSLTLRMQVETFVPVIERVYLPTLVSFCCFIGGLIVTISIASIMVKRGSSNTFTDIFAYQKHWNKLINMKRPSKAVKSIDGVRAISMMWVMIAHLYTQIGMLGDSRETVDALKNGEWSFITGGTPSVDSFFCVGGLLLAYLSTDTIVKTFSTIPAFCINWLFFMGNRWMRITPMVMAVAWTIVSVIPVVSDGWNYGLARGSQRTCESNLWYSFFYLDGWVHGVEGVDGFFCNGVTWYLSCDFFYFALFPFMAVAYGRRKLVGISLVLLCISGSMAHNMYSSFVSESYFLQQYRIMTSWPNDRELDPYMPPWARYHSHGVGVLFGWLLLAERKGQVISKFLKRRRPLLRFTLILATWAITLGTLWFIVFGLNYCFKVNWTEEGKYLAPLDFIKYPGTGSQYIESVEGCMTIGGTMNWTAVSIWNGSFRALWSAALSVMIILCDMRFGMLINWFLSSKPLLLVSKLSFGMYLLHYNIYAVFFPSIKHVILSDGYELFWAFTGLFTVTAIISLMFHLVVEAPFAAIWTIVLKLIKPTPKVMKSTTVESELPKVAVDEKQASVEEKL